MATFGQGINPQLGAIDYSPILRGSMAGAQMAAQGSQMIGQGLANLGQEVGKGIEKYAEQKKKNAERDGRVNTAIGSLQAIAKTMDKYGRKDEAEALRLAGYNLIQEPNLDKRAAMADTAIGSFLQGQQIETGARQRQLGEQAAQYVRAATQAGGNPFSAVVKDAAGGYSPMGAEAQALGQRQYQQQQLVDSEIAKNLREKQAPAGRIMTAEELKKIGPQYDFKSTPLPDGTFFVTNISPFAPAMNIDASSGAKNENIAYADLRAIRKGEINPILNNQPTLAILKDILAKTGKDGMLTGAFANLELTTKSALNATGLTDFKDVAQTQAYIGASGRLVAQVVSAFGSGTGISDADREYARSIAGGNVTLDKAALKKLIDLYEKGTAAQIKNFNADVTSAFGDKPKDFSYRSLFLTPERISGKLSADAESMLK